MACSSFVCNSISKWHICFFGSFAVLDTLIWSRKYFVSFIAPRILPWTVYDS